VCNTTIMDTAAVTDDPAGEEFGKKFFSSPRLCLRPRCRRAFQPPQGVGGTYAGDMLPIASVDFPPP